MPRWWAGIDWSEELQDVAIVDDIGRVVRHLRIEETPAGVQELLTALRGLHPTSHRFSRFQVPVAIEDGARLVAVELRRRRQPVVVIPPAVASRHRTRTAVATSKADRTDAALLANIIRMNPGFRTLPETSDQAAAIAVLARTHKDTMVRAAQMAVRLHSHLRLYFPAAIQAWATMEFGLRRAEARAVLTQAPTPRQAAALSKRRLADTLAAAGRIRMIDSEAGRLRDLFAVPQLRQPPMTQEAMGIRALGLLAELDGACREAERLAEQTLAMFSSHPHASIYRSFPALGSILGARIFAEIGDDPSRFVSGRALRAYAGVSPLTWASGGSRAVTHRRIANRRLKPAVHAWAFGALNRSPGCRRLYDARRERGDGYAAALRNVGGRLLSGLHHCLSTQQPYDETRMFPPSTVGASAGAG